MTSMEKVLSALGGRPYDVTNEYTTQEGITTALASAGISFRKEFSLSKRDRPDFYCEDGIVIEVKIKGGSRPREMLRQLSRYCEYDCVKAIILATGRTTRMPREINGKKVVVFSLSVGSL